jgi:hypothetical protein
MQRAAEQFAKAPRHALLGICWSAARLGGRLGAREPRPGKGECRGDPQTCEVPNELEQRLSIMAWRFTRCFEGAVSPLGLLGGALLPTLIPTAAFRLL